MPRPALLAAICLAGALAQGPSPAQQLQNDLQSLSQILHSSNALEESKMDMEEVIGKLPVLPKFGLGKLMKKNNADATQPGDNATQPDDSAALKKAGGLLGKKKGGLGALFKKKAKQVMMAKAVIDQWRKVVDDRKNWKKSSEQTEKKVQRLQPDKNFTKDVHAKGSDSQLKNGVITLGYGEDGGSHWNSYFGNRTAGDTQKSSMLHVDCMDNSGISTIDCDTINMQDIVDGKVVRGNLVLNLNPKDMKDFHADADTVWHIHLMDKPKTIAGHSVQGTQVVLCAHADDGKGGKIRMKYAKCDGVSQELIPSLLDAHKILSILDPQSAIQSKDLDPHYGPDGTVCGGGVPCKAPDELPKGTSAVPGTEKTAAGSTAATLAAAADFEQ